jgi:[ribosomal protein S5]-alanine N-acetyltransferase
MGDPNQVKLESENLIIIPLSEEQLIKYLRNDNSLEEELKISKSPRKIAANVKEFIENTLLFNANRKKLNFLYITFWTIISKAEDKMVGDLCFKGEPNKAGEIEIGYGIYPQFQNKGYMTEAIGAMINWAKTQPKVKAIIAETVPSNFASIKSLEKNNFIKYKTEDAGIWWRFDL